MLIFNPRFLGLYFKDNTQFLIVKHCTSSGVSTKDPPGFIVEGMNIHFEKSSLAHKDIISAWLAEPHMVEFWDNSQEHKDDILNFMQGKKQTYFYGTTVYWMGFLDGTPYCFLLSDMFQPDQDLSDLHRQHMSPGGHTIALDFGIGNKDYLGKGLAAPTLRAFVEFYTKEVDPLADTFFIDPDENNPRAQNVYDKAGFEPGGEFDVQAGAFKGSINQLMVRKLSPAVSTRPL